MKWLVIVLLVRTVLSADNNPDGKSYNSLHSHQMQPWPKGGTSVTGDFAVFRSFLC